MFSRISAMLVRSATSILSAAVAMASRLVTCG